MGKISRRQGSSRTKTGTCNTKKIKKALKKAQKTSSGLSCEKIISLTNCLPRFIGCFSEESLSTLKIFTKPVYLLVHIGNGTGHWVAVGIFSDTIEIFDPLGFRIFDWPIIPCSFLNFIHTFSTNKKLLLSGKVQPDSSSLCGFYCLLYVIKRPHHSFTQILSMFRKPHNNDKLLSSLF